MNIEDNLITIQEKLRQTKREGIEEFIAYLDTTDFMSAPASTKFHLNVLGGLMQHSLNVLRFAEEINKSTEADIPEESIILGALLHDICKINYYELGEEWDKEHKDKTNQWRKKSVWKVNDQEPLGHGEKSAILASKYIDLTTDELAAIRWHMGFSEPGVNFGYPTGQPFRESLNRYPLVKIVMLGDQMAELYETANNS